MNLKIHLFLRIKKKTVNYELKYLENFAYKYTVDYVNTTIK